MTTFCKIIHKQNAITYEFYNSCAEKDNFDYFRNAYSFECKVRSLEDVLINIFISTYVGSPAINQVKSKFDYLKTVLDNTFASPENKEAFLLKFCEAQKLYHRLNNLARRYKWAKAPYRITNDLFLNPIEKSQRNVMTIFQNGQKYLFTVLDLKNMIDSALSHSPYFFSEPMPIKNPYNNMPFSKAALYNIYYFMKSGNFVLSSLFHNYYMVDFNLKRFRNENEVTIRKVYVKNFLKTASLDVLDREIRKMLVHNKYSKKFCIDPEFPKERLVSVMRPYLSLYYTYMFTLDMSERYIAGRELDRKLKRFFKHNYMFGRKLFNTKRVEMFNEASKKIYTPYFNDDHIGFKEPVPKDHYSTSHVVIDDNDNILCPVHDTDGVDRLFHDYIDPIESLSDESDD